MDIRTTSYIKYVPHFNSADTLAKKLARSGIEYSYLGNLLGLVVTHRSHQPIVGYDYKREQARRLYEEGVQWVVDRSRSETLVLMCCEWDPSECHRHTHLAVDLAVRGVLVDHIMPDGHVQAACATISFEPKRVDNWVQQDLFGLQDADRMRRRDKKSNQLKHAA